MLTTARQDGSDWILNGEKTWITNGSVAMWPSSGHGPRLEFRDSLSERVRPASHVDIHGKLSMRASVTSSLFVSDCRVPKRMCCLRRRG